MSLVKKMAIAVSNGDLRVAALCRKSSVFCSIYVQIIKLFDLSTGGNIAFQTDKAVSIFLSDEQKRDIIYVEQLKKTVLACREKYLIDPNEFFLFGFERLNDEGCHQFIGNREKELICKSINKGNAWKVFSDKWQTYLRFKSYYGREAIFITGAEQKEDFLLFCRKHPLIVMKPYNLSQGRGILFRAVSTIQEQEKAFCDIQKQLQDTKGIIIEEHIDQGNELGVFHPQSINTVRYVVYTNGDRSYPLFSFARFGQGENEIDNAGAGGLFAEIDILTGVLCSDGFDKCGAHYSKHPDSGLQFKGYQLPRWKELLKLISEVVKVVADQKYVGWDLAYSKKGWVIVEGNSWAQMSAIQVITKEGLRPKLRECGIVK